MEETTECVHGISLKVTCAQCDSDGDMVDKALAFYMIVSTRNAERERCAEVARNFMRAYSKGSKRRAGSVEELGERVAEEILKS